MEARYEISNSCSELQRHQLGLRQWTMGDEWLHRGWPLLIWFVNVLQWSEPIPHILPIIAFKQFGVPPQNTAAMDKLCLCHQTQRPHYILLLLPATRNCYVPCHHIQENRIPSQSWEPDSMVTFPIVRISIKLIYIQFGKRYYSFCSPRDFY